MKQPLPVFTPSLAPAEVLERLFVARHQLADDIVDRIRAAATSRTRNHTLLIGPRGAGKTHLVSLVYHRAARLRDAGEIEVQLAWLPEDPWSTTSYRRLLDAIVDHLEPGLGLAEQPTSIEEIEALLAGRATELGPLVCFIENLDQVFDAIGAHGQQRLRHLAQARTLLFVAGTTTLSHDLSDQAAPFYGFFTTARLEPLTVEQAAEMLHRIAVYQGKDDAAAYLQTEQAIARLRAVAHLAGGQPRIWALLARAVTVGGLEELVQLLMTRFDDLTPYYQEQLARLSPQQRDVVVTLAELDHPANVKELAESTGIDQRSLAKTMVELRERGWVTETDSPLTRLLDRRRTYYELGEPLARLAFQLKASRGTPIQLVVEFLKSWFDPKELANEQLEDQLTLDYLQQAATGHETDPVLAVSRRLRALPASRVPVLDLLGQLDDACAHLAAGDPEPLLRMPSALRTAIEAQLAAEETDATSAATALRVRLHQDALEEFGHVPLPVGHTWLARAMQLVATSADRPRPMEIVIEWLGRLWRFDEAEDVLAEHERVIGTDHPDTITARAKLAYSYWSAGRVQTAIVMEQRVIADRERVLGPDHPDTLLARNNLAVSYHSAGRIEEAVALKEKVLADRERVLGPDHPDTLSARGNLAVSYRAQGRAEEALSMLEGVVERNEETFGVDHSRTLTSRANLAISYRLAGRTNEGMALEEQVVADRERVLGPDHPDTLLARGNLAVSYWSLGRIEEALVIEERVLAGRERLLGPDHPETLTARGNLAQSYWLQGRAEEGIDMLKTVKEASERLFGADHPDAQWAQSCLDAIEKLAQRPSD